jgi:hypothetical protein
MTNKTPTINALMKQKAQLAKQILAARQREHEKTAMTAQQYRHAVEEEFGMSIAQAGVLFGVSTRTSYRWAQSELPVPRSVAFVLKLMREHELKPEDLDASIKISGKNGKSN